MSDLDNIINYIRSDAVDKGMAKYRIKHLMLDLVGNDHTSAQGEPAKLMTLANQDKSKLRKAIELL